MENTTPDNTQITIADLNLLKNIVDLASTRGAFRGAELTQVGQVYDKLTTFLEAVVAQAQAQEDQSISSTDTTGTTDSTESQGE